MKFTNVVLIDDDRDDRELFIDATGKISPAINCTAYDSAEDALGKLMQDTALPDVIFLDLNMPRMNGVEFMEEVSKVPSLKLIHIFIYSTTNYIEVCKEKIKQLAARCITKPDSYDELVHVLQGIYMRG
jgi:CheY-like chemotaxis protein